MPKAKDGSGPEAGTAASSDGTRPARSSLPTLKTWTIALAWGVLAHRGAEFE